VRLHDTLSSKDDQTIDATWSMLEGYAPGLLKEARFSDMHIREPYWALFMAWDSRIRRRLKLRDLDTFLAVAQSGSMAKAAARLAVSQPAVSNAIAELERTLGVRLFDRLAQGVEPTPYGRALLKSAVAVFDDVQQGVNEIGHLVDPTVGELRIGASEPMIAGILPSILSRLNLLHPRIVFHVMQIAGGSQQARELRERRFDLFLGRVMGATNEDDLVSEILFDEPLFVAAGVQNSLVRRRKIKLAELVNEPWTLPRPESGIGETLNDIFKSCGLDAPPAVILCNSIHMQLNLLATGRFLTLFPRSVLHFGANRISIKLLPIELPVELAPVGIVTLKNRTISPVAQLFFESARLVARPLARSRS
jgi:DNA-binding transcriptional LysR family regulator